MRKITGFQVMGDGGPNAVGVPARFRARGGADRVRTLYFIAASLLAALIPLILFAGLWIRAVLDQSERDLQAYLTSRAAFLADRIDERTYHPTRDTWGPLVVPEDRYFVLGDNRDDSEDSRFWGFVHADAITGRPLLVYYSFDPATIGSFAYLTQVRWSRIGGLIH